MAITYTWLGHGTSSLSIGGFSVVIDPYFTDNPAASTTVDKVAADFILVSHGHGDHVGDVEALAKRSGALVISNHEIATWFEAKGLKTHGQHIGGGHQHPFGHLKLTMAEHGSKLPDGSNGGNPAGLLITARFGSSSVTIGGGEELRVITAAIIGGSSLSGGEGSVLGAFLGALFMGFLANALNLLGVDVYWQNLVTGALLIFAVVVDVLNERRKTRLQ